MNFTRGGYACGRARPQESILILLQSGRCTNLEHFYDGRSLLSEAIIYSEPNLVLFLLQLGARSIDNESFSIARQKCLSSQDQI